MRVFASTPKLSVLPGAGSRVFALRVAPAAFSSLLLSFAGDSSPLVDLPVLLSRNPDSQYNTAPYRDPSVLNFRGTSHYLPLSVTDNPSPCIPPTEIQVENASLRSHRLEHSGRNILSPK